MAKRDTVNVNCDNVLALIRANEWSNAAFSRKVGKYSSWFGEVLRGNNLPSPQEAAQMCVLLQTAPEEILLHEGEKEEETAKCQEDIALVRKLLEEMQGAKKAPAICSEGEKDALIDAVRGITDKDTALAVFDALSKKMRELM